MRNLLEYPITLDEIISCLQQLKSECDPALVGDMRPLLLDFATAAVQYRVLKLWQRGDLDGMTAAFRQTEEVST